MIEPKRYGNDEFYMNTGMWYRMNADGFDYVSNFIRRHCIKSDGCSMEYFNKSVEVIKFKLEHSQKLYIKISDEPSIHFLYRSDYNPRYMHEPWIDLNDAILNQSKDREQTSKEEFDALYNVKWPSNSILNDIILRSDDFIQWENNTGVHSGTVHDSDGKRIKDSSFANDEIIKIVRNGIVIYDRQAVNRAKRAEKLIMNSVYGARRFPTMDDNFDARFYADWDACIGKESNKEKEKVMEGNKIEAIREIVNKYEDNAAKELTRQYNEQEKEVKGKDPNIIALKQYIEVLNKNRKENTEPYNINTFNEIYTAETQVRVDELYNTLMSKKKALHDKCSEVYNICILCDTYEQMRQVLADYDIIPNTKKEGK